MAKKKTQKKETLHEKYSLEDLSPETATAYASHLEQMLALPGWQILKKMLESNLANVEQAIILKVDPESGMKITEAEVDEFRIQYAQIKQLLATPRRLIKMLSAPKEETGDMTYDPYQQSADPVVERRRVSTSSLV